jgi:hypothetical protein
MVEIMEALEKTIPLGEYGMTYESGWNAGVRGVVSGDHDRTIANPEDFDDPPHYVGGFYLNLDDENYYGNQLEWYEGWNEGKEAALAMKNGEKPVIEKSPEEIQYDRRMKCFTMAEKYAPRPAINGGEKEPVGETIKRAEVLMNYFYGGDIPGEAVKEGAK